MWLFWRAPAVNAPPPRVVRLTTLAGTEDWPAFSPDGQQVAFGWEGEKHDNADIYVTLVGSRNVRRLTTDPADDYAPSWSPDGLHIAFLRKAGSVAYIHVTSALGGPDLKVSDFPVAGRVPFSPAASQITWSPDGQYVVAGRDPRASVGTSAGIYLIPARGGAPRALTHDRSTPPSIFLLRSLGMADVSPYASCGKFDAFSPCTTRRTVTCVWWTSTARFARRLHPRTLTRQPTDQLDGLAWTRDGKSVVFYQAGTTSISGVSRLQGTAAPERIELAGSHAMHPATVASQDRLVFSRYDGDGHLYRFNAGRPTEQIAPSSSFETDPHFSPDGRRIAFASGRSGDVTIWVAAADGSGRTQLTQRHLVLARLTALVAGRALHCVRCRSTSTGMSTSGRSMLKAAHRAR